MFVTWRRPEQRPVQLGKSSIWLLAVTLVAGIQWSRHAAARQAAGSVASAVLHYSGERGSLPATLSDAGIDEAQIKAKWKLGHKPGESGQPLLFYANTFSPFQPYVYNFDTHEWELRPD